MQLPVPIALQLYSVREEAARDFQGVLERVARAGYLGVEFAGLHGYPQAAVRGWLADLGLTGVAAHRPMPIGNAANLILDGASELGVDTLIVPWAPRERFASGDAIKAFADQLVEAQHLAAPRALRIGYHNHEFEVEATVDGGTGLAHLFRATGPDVLAEVDVYWVRVGGCDPATVVAELGDQVRLLHIKDGPADGTQSPMTAIGSGILDIPAIVRAGSSVEWHIVGLDACATDIFQAIEASQRWLVERGLSRGRGAPLPPGLDDSP